MKPIVVANWKMNETGAEARRLFSEITAGIKEVGDKVEVVICPPFTALDDLGGNKIKKGAQNIHWEDRGTFTGEVSGPMLKEAGCEYVIVGHSERRWKLGETDEVVNRKLRAALRNQLIPILCVGERAEDRRAGRTTEVLSHQLGEALRETGREDINLLIIAYEPVWAIGTGAVGSRTAATPAVIAQAYDCLTDFLNQQELDDCTRLIYGGSVSAGNVSDFAAVEGNTGFLVGGASLVAAEFIEIVEKLNNLTA